MSGIGEEDQPKKTRFKPADSARFQNGGGTMNTANLHYLRPRACSAATAVTFTLLSIFGCADARGPATVSTDREIMIEASPSSRVVLTFWRLRHKQFVLSPDAIGGVNRILHSTVAALIPNADFHLRPSKRTTRFSIGEATESPTIWKTERVKRWNGSRIRALLQWRRI